jgi:mRNA interferase RelE/StbE
MSNKVKSATERSRFLLLDFFVSVKYNKDCRGDVLKRINFEKSAEKELKRIDLPTRRRIIDGIAGLLKEPPQGDIKQLKGNLGGLNRLRVGSWRIIYEATAETINILMISPRGGAYKRGV